METIKNFIIPFIFFTIIDYIWLTMVVKKYWSKLIQTIQIDVFKPKREYILPVYILMTCALSMFVLPNIKKETIWVDSIKYGGGLGLIVYGIFDLTNLILFSKYDLSMALGDIVWGTFLFTIVSYLSKRVLIYLKHLI